MRVPVAGSSWTKGQRGDAHPGDADDTTVSTHTLADMGFSLGHLLEASLLLVNALAILQVRWAAHRAMLA